MVLGSRARRKLRAGGGQVQLSWALEMGSCRIRLPVAAKIALHRAGGTGGRAGSPRPVGGLSVIRQCTSTGGAAAMRISG